MPKKRIFSLTLSMVILIIYTALFLWELTRRYKKIMQLIKGESSYWINHQVVLQEKFEWQEEYFAVSVSESQLKRVRNYILNQETHHQTKTFQEEYNEFILRYGFQRFVDE